MYLRSACLINFVFLITVIATTCCQGRPNREKRSGYSDQRLAELITLYNLHELYGQMADATPNYPLGIDPKKIGRRRRSSLPHVDQLRAELDEDRDRNDNNKDFSGIDEDLLHAILNRRPSAYY